MCNCCLDFAFDLNKCAATAELSYEIVEDDIDMVSDLKVDLGDNLVFFFKCNAGLGPDT